MAPPFRWEWKPRKRSSLAVSSRWAQSGPTSPRRAQRSSLSGSTPDPGARLYIANGESHAQDEGRVLGPLWPTSLAIAPAALAARAAGTMPGGYCRNSGTWGSPDDAKVEPTPSVPPEDQQEAKPGPEMSRPISARRPDQHHRPPQGEWVASGSNLSPGHRSRQVGPWVPWSCRRRDYSWRPHPY